MFSGNAELVSGKQLEATVTLVLSDIDAAVSSNDTEDCHGFGKPEEKTRSKKTVTRLVNREFCKKASLNRKYL